MNILDTFIITKRKLIRRLNWGGFFIVKKNGVQPVVIIAGYTRSGTTFLGRIIANTLTCRPIHEPLNPAKVVETSYFKERESILTLRENTNYSDTLKTVFGPHFNGNRYTNTGTSLIYQGRLVKIVRANHYLDYLSELLPGQKFVFIMRNPWACVASRLRLNWPVPDLSYFVGDIKNLLSNKQKTCLDITTSKAGLLAISWCIDNFMALRNENNPNFHFVHYEQLVLYPESVMKKLLNHIGQDYKVDNLKREISLEGTGHDAASKLDSWRKHMSDDDIHEVNMVLDEFNMKGFYSADTTLPLGKLPFMVVGD